MHAHDEVLVYLSEQVKLAQQIFIEHLLCARVSVKIFVLLKDQEIFSIH